MMIVWQQTQQQQEQSLFKMSTIELSFCYQQITMIIMQMIKYQNSINNISMMIKLNLNFQNSKIFPDFIPVYHCHWFVFFCCRHNHRWIISFFIQQKKIFHLVSFHRIDLNAMQWNWYNTMCVSVHLVNEIVGAITTTTTHGGRM